MEKENSKVSVQEEKQKKAKKLPKEVSQAILKRIVYNILKAIGIIIYFAILNLAYIRMDQERLIGDIQIFAGTFLVLGIVFLEISYKQDSGAKAITAIEFIVLSLHSLSIMHVITMLEYDFRFYLLTSSYIFAIYYVLKAIVIYTKERRKYLKSLSDISEIVKKDEPIKKEAKKRNSKEKEQDEQKEIKEEIALEGKNKKEKVSKKSKKDKEKPKKSKAKKTTSKIKATKKKEAKEVKKEDKENKKEEKVKEEPKKTKTKRTTSKTKTTKKAEEKEVGKEEKPKTKKKTKKEVNKDD